MTPIIIRTCPERLDMAETLQRQIPGAQLCIDKIHDAMSNFLTALRYAGDGPAVHMEDDVILTSDFRAKLEAQIAARPNEVIQFFSMRKADLTTGSRRERGRSFLMGQCFYLPAYHSKALSLYYFNQWPTAQKIKNPTGLDAMIADYLKDNKMSYWLHCPSLVQHIETKSVIDPRRSSKRQSISFVP